MSNNRQPSRHQQSYKQNKRVNQDKIHQNLKRNQGEYHHPDSKNKDIIELNRIASSMGLTRQQKQALFFVMLIGGGAAIDMNDKINNQDPKIPRSPNGDKKNPLVDGEKNELMRKVCSNETIAFNKPPKTTLVAEDGVIKTEGCFKNTNPGCETALANFYKERDGKVSTDKSLNTNLNTFLNIRESNKIEYQQWMTEFQKKSNTIISTLNEEQSKYFSNMIFMIGKLRQMYGSEKLVQASHMGNCAEQTNAAMKSFLFNKMEYGLKLKIQYISVSAIHPTNKNNVQDHRFLLLDGNIPDKSIKNNPKAVEHLLSRIKSGFYCDPWNHLFENAKDITEEKRSLYSGHGKWHSAEVQTIDLDFNKFKLLPQSAQKLICNELKAIGFPAELQPAACATWNPLVAKKQQEQNDSIRPELK